MTTGNTTPWARPLSGRDPAEAHRASTPLELFFDLTFVVAIASAAAQLHHGLSEGCLLYTSDAADERSSVDLGGRRIIKKKNT